MTFHDRCRVGGKQRACRMANLPWDGANRPSCPGARHPTTSGHPGRASTPQDKDRTANGSNAPPVVDCDRPEPIRDRDALRGPGLDRLTVSNPRWPDFNQNRESGQPQKRPKNRYSNRLICCGPGRRKAAVETGQGCRFNPARRLAVWNSRAINSAWCPSPLIRTPKRASFSRPFRARGCGRGPCPSGQGSESRASPGRDRTRPSAAGPGCTQQTAHRHPPRPSGSPASRAR